MSLWNDFPQRAIVETERKADPENLDKRLVVYLHINSPEHVLIPDPQTKKFKEIFITIKPGSLLSQGIWEIGVDLEKDIRC